MLCATSRHFLKRRRISLLALTSHPSTDQRVAIIFSHSDRRGIRFASSEKRIEELPSNRMVAMYCDPKPHLFEVPSPYETTEVVEIPLLVPVWQISALERVAFLRGMTTAEVLRQAIGDVLAHPGD
jgi:hypothetical protein